MASPQVFSFASRRGASRNCFVMSGLRQTTGRVPRCCGDDLPSAEDDRRGERADERAAVLALPERQGERHGRVLGAAGVRVVGHGREVADPFPSGGRRRQALELRRVARAVVEEEGLGARRRERRGKADGGRDLDPDLDLTRAGDGGLPDVPLSAQDPATVPEAQTVKLSWTFPTVWSWAIVTEAGVNTTQADVRATAPTTAIAATNRVHALRPMSAPDRRQPVGDSLTGRPGLSPGPGSGLTVRSEPHVQGVSGPPQGGPAAVTPSASPSSRTSVRRLG